MTHIFTPLTLAVFLVTTLSMTAQIDQVSVGASYSEQAYYNINTGEVNTLPNDAWDLAFSSAGQIDGGVFINESASLSGNGLEVYLAETTDWNEAITDVSGFVDTARLHNPESDWVNGAFNEPKDINSPFDYGWGEYNVNSHQIEGNRVFVIKMRDGSYLKFMVESLVAGSYNCLIANLDNSGETAFTVNKSDAGNHSIVYYSIGFQQVVELDFEYDLIFQRYTRPLDAGGGQILEYSVTGVLLAPGTAAVVADGVDIDLVNESDYQDQYTENPATIGHEWKAFDFSQGWIVDEDRAQFVKTRDGDIYKVIFYDFEGSSTGITTLEKTYIRTSSTSDVYNDDLKINIFPNPTSNYIILSGEFDLMNEIRLYDIQGKVIQNLQNTNGRIELSGIPSGNYLLQMRIGQQMITRKLTIK